MTPGARGDGTAGGGGAGSHGAGGDVTAERPTRTDGWSLDIDEVRARLQAVPDAPGRRDDRGGWQAATAIVVAPGADGPAIAMIRRAERHGDRWSGDMALPGGTRDEADQDLASTAARETREEIGIDPGPPVTRLPDQTGRLSRGTVACFAYVLIDRPRLVPDPREVAEALWVPLAHLTSSSAATRHRWGGIPFPAIEFEGRIIWGLTHRILGTFLEAIGVALPDHRPN
jgi:8-oxo-dGTP pyrophosphatase MutT (NUDIX family)